MQASPLDCIAGYLSCVYKLQLTYDGAPPPDAPATLVVKTAPEPGPLRDYSDKQRVFEREVRFYRDVASQGPFPTPKCYFSWYDETGNGLLIFEDLSRLAGGDQILGLTYEEVLEGIDSIAAVHAFFWEKTSSAPLAFMPVNVYALAEQYPSCWPTFISKFEQRLKPQALRLGKWVGDHFRALLDLAGKRPHTIAHCDLRAENLRFDRDSDRVALLDWQQTCRGLGAVDVARLACGSPTVDLTAEQHAFIGERWHQRLLEQGVTGYTLLEALGDYRLGFLINLANPVVCSTLIDVDGTRGQELLHVMIERYFHAAVVMNDPAVLPASLPALR